MALDAMALALQIQEIEDDYNGQYFSVEDLPAKRLEMNQRIEQARFDHIISNIELLIPGTGMFAASYPVTGESITGTVQ